LLKGFRFKIFGNKAVNFLEGKLKLRFDEEKGEFQFKT
jgi:hypothetical protein